MTDMALQHSTTLYAGFWRRVIAIIIDAIVLTIIEVVFGGIIGLIAGLTGFGFDSGSGGLSAGLVVLLYVVGFGFQWLYFALMESGAKQATLGKMALSIKVTDLEGRRIGF